MKTCPKCSTEHNKSGTFCSRPCANSRQWSDEDKRKKSIANKNNKKLQEMASDPDRIEKLRESARQQWKEGRGVSSLSDPVVHRKTVETKKKCFIEKLKDDGLDEKLNYRKACKFRFNVYDYPDHFDLNLLEEYGWYSAPNKGNNVDGVSRDHLYSIQSGFENNIDPYYISHPANCKIIPQVENWKKRTKCSITIEHLIEKVKKWDKDKQL